MEQLNDVKQSNSQYTQYSTPLNVINPEIQKGLIVCTANEPSSSSSMPNTWCTSSRNVWMNEVRRDDTQADSSNEEQ
ncbi:hypothetical protein Tcan_02298 [Toxocara canis]|uniref:Uncharacterized protein n=1 Tax=Toxocara canis TaxID=6265 RepID=A0A0B2UQ95_TOXCA|nr:hypothetical protein Tcan_02298 [Toxocara canis]